MELIISILNKMRCNNISRLSKYILLTKITLGVELESDFTDFRVSSDLVSNKLARGHVHESVFLCQALGKGRATRTLIKMIK